MINRALIVATTIVAAILVPSHSYSIHKCLDKNGAVTFSNVPCDIGQNRDKPSSPNLSNSNGRVENEIGSPSIKKWVSADIYNNISFSIIYVTNVVGYCEKIGVTRATGVLNRWVKRNRKYHEAYELMKSDHFPDAKTRKQFDEIYKFTANRSMDVILNRIKAASSPKDECDIHLSIIENGNYALDENQNVKKELDKYISLYDDAYAEYKKGNFNIALPVFMKLAAQGEIGSQYFLAQMYQKGEGVPKSNKEAAKWYRKAAEQGFSSAQNSLGILYNKGRGVHRDYKEAVKWYRMAAEQNHSGAQNNLGLMYVKGLGVVKSKIQAYFWWNMAFVGGDKQAGKNLARVTASMTMNEKAEARRLIKKWIADHS